MTKTTENTIEQTALDWLESLGYKIAYGADIAFDGARPVRDPQAN